MGPLTTNWDTRGSAWYRWDPHIHAPGTVLADGFDGDWEGYISRLEKATTQVRALGVTDYCCISTYRAVLKFKEEGRLPGVELLFPNVELRLDLRTDRNKGVNIHLLFSPEDPDHVNQIERVLNRLYCDIDGEQFHCTRTELVSFGRKVNPDQMNENGAFKEGVEKFKVTFKDLKRLFREETWIRKNCLVAVVAAEGDGTSGLKNESSFTPIRQDIERFAHLIFSGHLSDREFWLGRKALSPEEVEKNYRCLKACLHGCDAHRLEQVAAPDQKRYCWVKGDLSFETLRQILVEPEERVWIGDEPPLTNVESVTISQIRPIGTPWLKKGVVEFNPGLVSVIGARGSGKTALTDLLAAGAHALSDPLGESSFLRRATDPEDLIGEAEVEETWADGEKETVSFRPPSELFQVEDPKVCYLSQHFVNRLCSASGLAKELREEIERVIFEQTEHTDRFETNAFAELAEYLLEPVHRRREVQASTITEISEKIAEEERLHDELPKLRKDRASLIDQLNKAQKEVRTILPKGQEERAKRLLALEEACTTAEGKVEAVARKEKSLNELLADVDYIIKQQEPQRLAQMEIQFAETGFTDEEWEQFGMEFKGDVKSLIASAKKAVAKETLRLINGDPAHPVDRNVAPLADWPLEDLKAERAKVKATVGIDRQKQLRYEALQRAITTNQGAIRTANNNIKHAEGADQRRRDLIESRRLAYKEAFETLVEEKEKLESLYAPLQKQIDGAKGALGKLSFVVRREVKLDDWVKAGEALMDLRNQTQFRGVGSLAKHANQLLLAWRVMSPEGVAAAMHKFVADFWKDILAAMPPSVKPEEKAAWMCKVGNWLYSTDHISIRYALEYDKVEIERLSPGTRGIVLLLLYLAIDKSDRRPLLIDQPEENLDPKSVFDDLVPHFREARKRRQIIIVTHNANLVVNTDADQVIVASCEPGEPGKLPSIDYTSGSLENPEIRASVCDILEGGERAFLERERRYRLEWEQMLGDQEAES
jgi:energy-coupling factor transporter ATP-binding protein EcfA2